MVNREMRRIWLVLLVATIPIVSIEAKCDSWDSVTLDPIPKKLIEKIRTRSGWAPRRAEFSFSPRQEEYQGRKTVTIKGEVFISGDLDGQSASNIRSNLPPESCTKRVNVSDGAGSVGHSDGSYHYDFKISAALWECGWTDGLCTKFDPWPEVWPCKWEWKTEIAKQEGSGQIVVRAIIPDAEGQVLDVSANTKLDLDGDATLLGLPAGLVGAVLPFQPLGLLAVALKDEFIHPPKIEPVNWALEASDDPLNPVDILGAVGIALVPMRYSSARFIEQAGEKGLLLEITNRGPVVERVARAYRNQLLALRSIEGGRGFPSQVTVEPGDNLWKLAETIYGDGRFYVAVQEYNQMRAGGGNKLRLAQQLEIPTMTQLAADGLVFIRKGDSLWGISQGVSGDGRRYKELFAANQVRLGRNPNLVYPIQRIDVEKIKQ